MTREYEAFNLLYDNVKYLKKRAIVSGNEIADRLTSVENTPTRVARVTLERYEVCRQRYAASVFWRERIVEQHDQQRGMRESTGSGARSKIELGKKRATGKPGNSRGEGQNGRFTYPLVSWKC